MLIELAILLSSCSAAGASLGVCKSECPTAQGASYTICQERESQKTTSSKPIAPKPKRLCSYYVNGTIDIPTVSVITAWVEVGSRLCIGDQPPVPAVPRVKSVAEQAADAFTAYAIPPFAYLSPSTQAEITEPVNFGVNVGGGSHAGELFGSAAEIKFVATSVSWSFSDGQTASGRNVTVSFADPGQIAARASVDWVVGAGSAGLDSNSLSLEVIDPPRRSLLRD